MPKKTSSRRHVPAAVEPEMASVVERRVDAPHLLAKDEPSAPDAPPPDGSRESAEKKTAEGETVRVARQLRIQADQLALHLRSRQRELDRREAELNARAAQFDHEGRVARLTLGQQQEDFEQRSAALQTQERDVEQRLARLAGVEATLDRKRAEWEEQHTRREEQLAARADRLEKEAAEQQVSRERFLAEMERRESDLLAQKKKIDLRREASLQLVRQLLAGLQRRRLEIETRAGSTGTERTPETHPLSAELLQQTEALELRQQRLDEAEAELARSRTEVDRLREEWLGQRDQDREAARAERQRMAQEQRRALAELDEKRQAIERRSEQLDQNWTALEQMRNELGRMHRETLEIRLATEELWVQMAGSAPPAAITHSLGQIRSRLADDYRLANVELGEKKRELQALYDQLAAQHEKLRRHKEELERWTTARQEEIQQQAQRLVAREQELEHQEVTYRDATRRWESERLDFEQELRRLRLHLCAFQAQQV